MKDHNSLIPPDQSMMTRPISAINPNKHPSASQELEKN